MCISILLSLEKLPQIEQLKITPIDYLLVLYSSSHVAVTGGSTPGFTRSNQGVSCPESYQDSLERICFCTDPGNGQNPVPWVVGLKILLPCGF